MHIVRTSLPSKKIAKKFAEEAVKQKLASCAIYFKISSSYYWKKKFCLDDEWMLELKCKDGKKALNWLERAHPYKCPMIYSIRAHHVLKKYAKWLGNSKL